jgi:two-component system chemotaxis sensor kinase CheA
MDLRDEDFFKELLKIFQMETKEHIQEMLTGIHELELHQATDKQFEIAETIHRAAHSMKGAARTIGLSEVEPSCQALETVFNSLKRQKVSIPTELIGMFDKAIRNLDALLDTLNEEGKVTGDRTEINRLIEEIQNKMSIITK